jgi:hypothetical protein
MPMDIYPTEVIPKERIPELVCKHTEVLQNEQDLEERRQSIERAINLSKNFYLKAHIIFETEEGLKEVITTIWAAGEKHIVLKGGITLPICCIRKVTIL